ncbi:hypothetical protein K7432_005912 [Basidiobolus ranarum]|uniref:Uncharacterized protein n=1 Tax=Basidiobolus ranarum TaxID=34480 RepID=A0ABR2WVQ4_9FUNG
MYETHTPTGTHKAHESTQTQDAQMSAWTCNMHRSIKTHKSRKPTKIHLQTAGPSFEMEGSDVKSGQGEVKDLGSTGSGNISPGMYGVPQDPGNEMEIAPTSPTEDSSSDETMLP